MLGTAVSSSATYRDADGFREATCASVLDWEPRSVRGVPVLARAVAQRVADLRLLDFQGEPLSGSRGPAEIARDEQDYLGILYQRSGRTLVHQGDQRAVVHAGDIAIWHSARPITLEMPERFHKLCMVVPIQRIETVLPDAASYAGLHLRADTHVATLLGAYLASLADNILDEREPHGAAATMDMTLELLSVALAASRRAGEERPHTTLFDRIVRYIDHRLGEPDLSPTRIALAHGISLRYLYLLFSKRGATVSGWIRARRLARCRAELGDTGNARSITEIAYKWGFNDSAHFSRTFKSAFGHSPKAYRQLAP